MASIDGEKVVPHVRILKCPCMIVVTYSSHCQVADYLIYQPVYGSTSTKNGNTPDYILNLCNSDTPWMKALGNAVSNIHLDGTSAKLPIVERSHVAFNLLLCLDFKVPPDVFKLLYLSSPPAHHVVRI